MAERIRKTLLVEGKNDEKVVEHLLKWHEIDQSNLKIRSDHDKNEGGLENLLNVLPVRLVESEPSIIGIIVDADEEVVSRWKQVTRILKDTGYSQLPDKPEADGTIINRASTDRKDIAKKVGIWIMPDNNAEGMLEDFVSFLVPDRANNPIWQLAGRCSQEAQVIEPQIPLAKAHIHTYLAWREEPGTPMGLAITKKYFDAEAPYAQRLVQWLNRLFN